MRIPAHQVSPPFRALFEVGQPLAIRCFAVLDGSIRGQISTNDPARPSWGAVQQAAFGTLFLARRPKASLVQELVEQLRCRGIIETAQVSMYLLAGDTSYNQRLLLEQRVDGVSPNARVTQRTLQHILGFARVQPLVYLPTHDSESVERLKQKRIVVTPR